jgi:hypothetical protein
VRRLASGLVFVLAAPLLAVVPLDAVPGAVTGAITGGTAKAHPVTPALHNVSVPAPSGLLHSATVGGRSTNSYSEDTDPFSMISASWDRGSLATEASLQVQTRSAGTWSSWHDLDASDSGPDAGTPDARSAVTAEHGKVVSDGVWVGSANGARADAVRVRVVGGGALPAGLQLSLIDPGTSAADAHPGGTESGAVAHAATQMPQIYTRADWGADESLRSRNPGCGTPQYTDTIKVGFVHHTATTNDYTPDPVPALLRAIYADHVLSNGWCDIGYNFVIDKFGRIWEGRYGGMDQPVLGAHTGGFNTDSFGVSLLGNYETQRSNGTTPPPAMLDALESLLAWKLGMYGRDALGTTTLTSAGGPDTRYPAGQVVTFNVIAGHRDAGDTLCPGNEVYSRLPQIRSATEMDMLGAALVGPKVAADFSPDDGDVVVTAGMLSPGTWRLDVKNGAGALVRTLTGSGSSVNAVWDRTDSSGAQVPNGPYRLTLSSTQNGIDAIPWSANIVLGRSIGAINQAFSGAPGSLTVQGWVLRDRTATSTSVRVKVDGGYNGTVIADMPRDDVASHYPQWGRYHGYDVTVPAAPGTQHVCVYGVNAGIPDTELDCRSVDVAAPARAATDPAGNPFGSLDAANVTAPGTVAIRGWTLDPDTHGGVNTDAYVDGHPNKRMVADDPRGDIGRTFAGFGDRHGFSATLHMAGGSHQICTYGINVGFGSGNPALACRQVSLPTGPPYGSVDAVHMTGIGQVMVRGWAIDPDTVDPVRVDMYVDGKGAASMTADADRPDVARIYSMYGPAHGFQTTLKLSGGTHQVCVFAINLGPGGNTLMSCQSVTLPTGPPVGSYDVAQMTAPGQVLVRGWALDPDSADPVRIDFYVDGKGFTSVQADGARPDIAGIYPLYGPDHGFQTALKLPGGKHQICAFAINLGPASSNPLLGCRTVTLPTGTPFGAFDSAKASGSGQVAVRGWAIDPDTAGPIRVDFYIDGKGAASLTANADRPDIAAAFPGYGQAHGFAGTLKTTPGKHEVCAYAINVGGGAPNLKLGCLPFTAS